MAFPRFFYVVFRAQFGVFLPLILCRFTPSRIGQRPKMKSCVRLAAPVKSIDSNARNSRPSDNHPNPNPNNNHNKWKAKTTIVPRRPGRTDMNSCEKTSLDCQELCVFCGIFFVFVCKEQ